MAIDLRESLRLRALRDREDVRPAPPMPSGVFPGLMDPQAQPVRPQRKKPVAVVHTGLAPTPKQLKYLDALYRRHRGEPSKAHRRLWKKLTRGKVGRLIDELASLERDPSV